MGEPQKCLESYQYPRLYFDWYLKRCHFPVNSLFPQLRMGRRAQRASGGLGGWQDTAGFALSGSQPCLGEVTALLLWGNHGEIWGIAPGAGVCLALLLGLPQSKHLLQGDPRRKRGELAAQSAAAKR